MDDELDDLKLDGIWWLPNTETEKIGGILTFSYEKGGLLKLLGAFGGIRALNGFSANIIHGVVDRKVVTLQNVYTKQSHFSSPGFTQQDLYIESIFVGAHLTDKDLKFDRADISFDFLPEFVNKTSINQVYKQSEKTNNNGIEILVSAQDDIELFSSPNFKASVKFSWRQTGKRLRNITIYENNAIKLEFKNRKTVDNIFSDYIRPIQNFITLATDTPNKIVKVIFYISTLIDEFSHPVTVQYYYRTISNVNSKKGPLLSSDMLFTLSDLKRNQFIKWIRLSKKFEPVVNILFGQRFNSGIYVENLLLNVVSCLEAYHQRKFRDYKIDPIIWNKRIEKIISLVPSEKKLLKQIFRGSNSKFLTDRISEVLNYSGLASDLMTDSVEWCEIIRDNRNVLTHYNPKKEIIDDYELIYWIVQSISWVMVSCLLREVGFTKEESFSLVCSNRRYQNTRENLKHRMESFKKNRMEKENLNNKK